MAKVAIIGQGYVGLTIAAFASKSNQVVGFDSNQKVVDQLCSQTWFFAILSLLVQPIVVFCSLSLSSGRDHR